MVIRPATPVDVPNVVPMVRALCDEHHAMDPQRYDTLGDVEARYEHWLPLRAADARSVFLVAEVDGAVVGFLVSTVERNIPIYHRGEFGFIHDMWVEPAHRRRGLARALVQEALQRFGRIGVDQVRLETAALNEAARRLFQSCGFRVGTVDMLRELP